MFHPFASHSSTKIFNFFVGLAFGLVIVLLFVSPPSISVLTISHATPSSSTLSLDVEMARRGPISFPTTNDDLSSVDEWMLVRRHRHRQNSTSSTPHSGSLSKDLPASSPRVSTRESSSCASTRVAIPTLTGSPPCTGLADNSGHHDPQGFDHLDYGLNPSAQTLPLCSQPISHDVEPNVIPTMTPTELQHLPASPARDVFMSEAPTHSPLSVISNLHLQADRSTDLQITFVLKKKGLTRASSKTFKKSLKTHRCNSALFDTIHNDDSPTSITDDAVTPTQLVTGFMFGYSARCVG